MVLGLDDDIPNELLLRFGERPVGHDTLLISNADRGRARRTFEPVTPLQVSALARGIAAFSASVSLANSASF